MSRTLDSIIPEQRKKFVKHYKVIDGFEFGIFFYLICLGNEKPMRTLMDYYVNIFSKMKDMFEYSEYEIQAVLHRL